MKKLIALFCIILLTLSLAGCAQQAAALSLAEESFQNVTQVKLYNCHNGQYSVITDPDTVADICDFIRGVSGTASKKQEGFYEGTYDITLLDPNEKAVFEIAFGDSDAFYCIAAGDTEATRYDMADLTAKDAIAFFAPWDTSGFQWE